MYVLSIKVPIWTRPETYLMILIPSIVVVGMLTCWALLHPICDLKTRKMNKNGVYFRNLCFTSWKRVITLWEQPKTFVMQKVKVQLITEQLPKKFCLSCKNLDDQEKSGRLKRMNSEVILETTEENQWGAIGEYQVGSESHCLM